MQPVTEPGSESRVWLRTARRVPPPVSCPSSTCALSRFRPSTFLPPLSRGILCPAGVALSLPSQSLWRPQRFSSWGQGIETEKAWAPWAGLAVHTLREARPTLGPWAHSLQADSRRIHTTAPSRGLLCASSPLAFLGSHTGSTTYQLCDLGQIILTKPQLSHL